MNGFEMRDRKYDTLEGTPELLNEFSDSGQREAASAQSEARSAQSEATSALLAAVRELQPAASAAMVNRTHRVVRQRAKTMQEQRSRIRSLWIPLSVCAPLFVAVVFAVWSVIDSYEISVDAIPDSGQQMMAFMMWCLPLSLIVVAVVWFTRSGTRTDGGAR